MRKEQFCYHWKLGINPLPAIIDNIISTGGSIHSITPLEWQFNSITSALIIYWKDGEVKI